MTYIASPLITAQFVNDVFSGTGSQTMFTLTYAPFSINSILVMVGNTLMNPNTYSLSGANLTFGTAPASGTNNISVRHLGVPAIPFTAAAGSITTNAISATGTASASTVLTGNGSWSPPPAFYNRIINGHMYLDQRNSGASITPSVSGTYCLDRWATFGSQPSKFSVQQSSSGSVPGFIYYLAGASTSAYTIGASEVFGIAQVIEGFNIADLAYGNASAKTCTLSFWARASQTGQYGIFLKNGGVNVSGYSNFYYVTSYNIVTANTWEYKTITINPPTSGQWEGQNGAGLCIVWSYGAGATVSGGTPNAWSSSFFAQPSGCVNLVATSGATLHITGVQYEAGSTATNFAFRPIGEETLLAYRYYRKHYFVAGFPGLVDNASNTLSPVQFPVTMRDIPTMSTTGTANNYQIRTASTSTNCTSVPTFDAATAFGGRLIAYGSGLTQGNPFFLVTTSGGYFLAWAAEL